MVKCSIYLLLGTDRHEIRTKFELHKYKELIENKSNYSNMYVKLVILATKNKNINHLKQNCNDLKIQLARKIKTDGLRL